MNIRLATEADKPHLAELIAKDPYHSGKLIPEFFIGLMYDEPNKKWIKDPTVECAVLEDEKGPVLYIRYVRSFRMSIQFDMDERKRNLKMLMEGFPVFREMAKSSGFKEIVFDSVSTPLIALTTKRMGFKASPDYVLPL
jgi:hypothetical protein